MVFLSIQPLTILKLTVTLYTIYKLFSILITTKKNFEYKEILYK